jgi:hypothetical protein
MKDIKNQTYTSKKALRQAVWYYMEEKTTGESGLL